MTWLRRERGQSRQTIEGKSGAIARFFDFMISRYQGDLHALTGVVVVQPIDEFNRPASSWTKSVRVPPSNGEIEALFDARALPCPRPASTCRQRGTTWPLRCGVELAALTAFHALRAGDLINARLADVADGRMRLGDRTIPLAAPVQLRVSAWLDHRTRRWPNTANPHLFVNIKTCTNTRPVGRRWPGLTLGMAARLLREDRILHEIEASAGDVRRICDLFGLTVAAALRYLPELDTEADTNADHPRRSSAPH